MGGLTAEPLGPLDAAVILDAAPDAVVVVDRGQRIVLANASAEHLFGAARGALVGAALHELLPLGAHARHHGFVAGYFAAPTRHLMGSGRALAARRRDGTELEVEIALAPAHFGDQDVVVAVLRDRSVEQRLERARRDAEAQAACASAQLDYAAQSIVLLDASGRIAHVNGAWVRFARDNHADVATTLGVGVDYLEVCRSDAGAHEVLRGIEAVLARRLPVFQHRYRCNSPSAVRRFHLRVEPLASEGECARGGVVIVHTDVTEQVMAEERLAVQREVAYALAAGLPVTDVCRLLGDQVCRRLEWDCWELWGSDGQGNPRLLELSAPHDIDIEPFMHATRSMAFGPGVGLPGRVWSNRRPEVAASFSDDPAYPRAAAARACGIYAAFAVPLVSGGEVFLMMSFFSRRRRSVPQASVDLLLAIGAQIAEVSRRQRAEDEARASRAELDAAQRLASVGALAAGVAHEINNPLSALIGNLQLAAGEVDELAVKGVVAAELAAELADARDAADRIRGVARDLKLLASPTDEAAAAVDAQAVCETMLRLAAHEIRNRARVVRRYLPVPLVAASEGRLGQVVLNLLINAAHAIPDGHVAEHEVRIGTMLAPDGMVCLEVKDTGSGISDEVMRKLFTPFFTTKAPGFGTGLGLAICDKIVRGFGGRIEVESAPGAGAAFRVLLPAARADATARPGPTDAATVTITRGRVLVIDDEPTVGRAVRRILAPLHDVTVTGAVRDALALLEGGARFDVVLCDVMMPELGAVDFLEALGRRLPDQLAKVVLITGGAFSPRARALIESGAHVVIDKPFDPVELRNHVAEHMRRLSTARASAGT